MKDDLISRQDAIDAFRDKFKRTPTNAIRAKTRLEGLPSVQPDLPIKEKCAYCPHCENCDVNDDLSIAQPERKKGHWIVVTRHEHYPSGKPYEQLRCPFCKRFDHNGDGNFCGYCGAELR